MHLFTALHVFAVTVWIGSIACVGWLLAAAASAPSEAEGGTAAELAFGLYRRAASPAFGIAFFAGLARLALFLRLHLLPFFICHAAQIRPAIVRPGGAHPRQPRVHIGFFGFGFRFGLWCRGWLKALDWAARGFCRLRRFSRLDTADGARWR